MLEGGISSEIFNYVISKAYVLQSRRNLGLQCAILCSMTERRTYVEQTSAFVRSFVRSKGTGKIDEIDDESIQPHQIDDDCLLQKYNPKPQSQYFVSPVSLL